ncbi:uncharacterized protein LOC122246320 [Penaeus japonicus]|uniref:uncharacterized protein LOC122246320 n=1 Tax=Penaeus japonicus TaxID=27405 RepID=UPI001C70B6BE|nr:uncharacterized protein LOC122246320 [Penaeus japonicus]XP_042860779.1 uncharacterized protein LOC122246320 [Penaeus japonicus]
MSEGRATNDSPPSYSETMLGVPAASNSLPPASTPARKANSQPAPSPALPPVPYSVGSASFPPGLAPLLSHHGLTVTCKTGTLSYMIKDISGQEVFTAKGGCETNSFFNPFAGRTEFAIRDLNKLPLVKFLVILDEIGFSFSKSHLEVSFVPDIPIGQVKVRGRNEYDVTNNGGDLIYTVEAEVGCCEILPYKICSPGGMQVGSIEQVNRVKHKVLFPVDLDIRRKALLLSATVFMQMAIELRRR